MPKVSIVITTKNEEQHIENCLRSIVAQTYPADQIETIVVDNNSTDRTKEIAKKYTANVFNYGPERSAQRNYGMIEKATGEYAIYLDADMMLNENVITECVAMMGGDPSIVGLYIPEIILGDSYWCKVRRFERSFYTGTVIDCVRLVKRSAFCQINGFDLQLTGPEDWDMDRRIRAVGATAITTNPIYHNEAQFNLRKYLKKKGYYAKNFNTYIQKWGPNDPEIKKQLGWSYRFFGVFVESGKWRHLVSKPMKAFGVCALRTFLGIIFLTRHHS